MATKPALGPLVGDLQAADSSGAIFFSVRDLQLQQLAQEVLSLGRQLAEAG